MTFLTLDSKSSQSARSFLWPFSYTFGHAYSPLNSATLSCSSEVTLNCILSDLQTGNVLSQQLKTKNTTWQRIMKKGDIKWDSLWSNFKNFQPAWRHLTFKAFLIGFALAIFKFGLSGLDLGGDINMSYLFIYGDTYVYHLTNETHELITHLNCSFRNETRPPDIHGVQIPMYDCFVQDKVAGFLSLVFTMTPGILSCCYIGRKLWKSSTNVYFWIFIILIPVQVVLFPVMIIAVKVSISHS